MSQIWFTVVIHVQDVHWGECSQDQYLSGSEGGKIGRKEKLVFRWSLRELWSWDDPAELSLIGAKALKPFYHCISQSLGQAAILKETAPWAKWLSSAEGDFCYKLSVISTLWPWRNVCPCSEEGGSGYHWVYYTVSRECGWNSRCSNQKSGKYSRFLPGFECS